MNPYEQQDKWTKLHLEDDSALIRRQQELREKRIRVIALPTREDVEQRIKRWLAGQTAALDRKLLALSTASDFVAAMPGPRYGHDANEPPRSAPGLDEALRDVLPEVLQDLLAKKVEARILEGAVHGLMSAEEKRKRLAEIDAESKKIEWERDRRFFAHKHVTAARQF